MYQNKSSNWGYKTPRTQRRRLFLSRERTEQVIPLRLDDVNMKLDVSDVLYDSSSVSSDSGTSQSSRVSHDFLSSITNSSILPSNVSTGWVLYFTLLRKCHIPRRKNRFYYINMVTYVILRYICTCRRMNVCSINSIYYCLYDIWISLKYLNRNLRIKI